MKIQSSNYSFHLFGRLLDYSFWVSVQRVSIHLGCVINIDCVVDGGLSQYATNLNDQNYVPDDESKKYDNEQVGFGKQRDFFTSTS